MFSPEFLELHSSRNKHGKLKTHKDQRRKMSLLVLPNVSRLALVEGEHGNLKNHQHKTRKMNFLVFPGVSRIALVEEKGQTQESPGSNEKKCIFLFSLVTLALHSSKKNMATSRNARIKQKSYFPCLPR